MKNKLITIISVSASIIAIVLLILFFPKSKKTTTTRRTYTTSISNIKQKTIVVEIKGDVVYPGVYYFNQEEVIIQDVINRAGGLLITANVSSLNLAERVSNNSCIIIDRTSGNSYVIENGYHTSKININTASLEQLMSISGIGETIAKNIINYRKNEGSFTKLEDIKKVSGIGDSLYEKIKDSITV